MLTCLCSHAIHLENSHSLGTDFFFWYYKGLQGEDETVDQLGLTTEVTLLEQFQNCGNRSKTWTTLG